MEPLIDAPTSTEMPGPTRVVETLNLGKFYRTGFWMNQKIESLKSCTLSVFEGETFGLLGQNGAGKTTLLKTLLGIVRPTSGRGLLLGRPLGDRTVKQRVGYLPENPYFYDYLTGWEFLQFAAGLFQIPPSIQRQRIPHLLDLVGLSQSAAIKKQLRQYSKGMLQRIGMAQALINNPDVVFLDEPMSGLDPMGRYQMREIILSLKTQGKTIFFNSHILSDVEKICDRVAILARGELICIGSIDELLGNTETYRVQGRGGHLNILKKWIPDMEVDDDLWYGHLHGTPKEFISSLSATGGQLIGMNLAKPTLEEFFMQQLQERGIYSSG
jgi:ABC-2 type transport system ATP-binding protein